MKKILIFAFFQISISNAASLEGGWQGYCHPFGIAESRLCSYYFESNGKGSYSCEFYRGHRCEVVSGKYSRMEFEYSLIDSSKMRLHFGGSSGDELIVRYKIKNEKLIETGLKLRKAGQQNWIVGLTEPIYYTRIK
jgi:hypothetical protein